MKIGMVSLDLYNSPKISRNTRFCADQDTESEKLTPDQQKAVCNNKGLIGFVMSPSYYNSRSPKDKEHQRNLKILTKLALEDIDKDSLEYEEYQREGEYGLCIAAQKYDPDKKVLFSTYACERIAGAIVQKYRDNLRERQKYEHEIRYPNKVHKCDLRIETPSVSLDLPVGVSGEPLYSFVEAAGTTPSHQIAADDEKEKQLTFVKNFPLDARERYILQERAAGKTYENIGCVYGLTRQRVEQLYKRTLRDITKAYEDTQGDISLLLDEGIQQDNLRPNITLSELIAYRKERAQKILLLHKQKVPPKMIAREVPCTINVVYRVIGANKKEEAKKNNLDLIE